MLFQKRYWEPIRRGEVTLTFRRWRRCQVVAGRVYRTRPGRLHVTDVAVVEPAAITDEDAVRSGHASAVALLADLPGAEGDPIYRIAFAHLDEPDPRTLLAEDADLDAAATAALDLRLARLDRASSHGAWTRAYLEAIAAEPGRRAPDLAARFGRETQPFKTDVRKLKNLGLTVSLPVGYRLSPRGASYLNGLRERA